MTNPATSSSWGAPPADLTGWADALVRPGPDQDRPTGAWDVVATPAGAVLLVRGDAVVKVHRAGTAVTGLADRLRLLAEPRVAPLWAPLLVPGPVEVPVQVMAGRRVASVWGRLRPLDPRSSDQPWAQSARLLARLHAVRATPDRSPPAPLQGGPARLRRAVRRVEAGPASPASTVVLRAARSVGAELSCDVPAGTGTGGLVHGDWHLGQVGYLGAGGKGALRLMDADDLGYGDPAWDLARPAGFWAAGILTDDDWQTFLAAYRGADGCAVPPAGDPWPRLDLPARAAVVVAAAAALGRDVEGPHLEGRDDDAAEALIEACARIANAG